MLFGYVFFLIFTYPVALLIHSVVSERLGITKSKLFEAFIYGVLCSPCFVVIGEGHRNKALALGLYSLFQGYDNSFTLLQMSIFTIVLFFYLKYKSN
jgi:hypothetical protein